MTGGVDRLGAGDVVVGDDIDSAIFDADVSNCVVHRLRVHDPAVSDDQVVVLGRGNLRGREEPADEAGLAKASQ